MDRNTVNFWDILLGFHSKHISPKTHKCFRYDRKGVDKTKSGAILLYIPYKLESKELPELSLCDMELFESK